LGITLNAAVNSTIHLGATVSTTSVTGGNPQRTRNRHITTESIKLITWFLVKAEVMLVTDRYAPAKKKTTNVACKNDVVVWIT